MVDIEFFLILPSWQRIQIPSCPWKIYRAGVRAHTVGRPREYMAVQDGVQRSAEYVSWRWEPWRAGATRVYVAGKGAIMIEYWYCD